MYQGELDGLCGPYAIVNALEHCGLANKGEKIFRTACNSIANRRWPAVLWEGTTYADLKRMIAACLRSDFNHLKIKASYPFDRNPPLTNKDFWIRFDNVFDDELARCAIMVRWKPDAHWIVALREGTGSKVTFVDAHPNFPKFRKRRSSIFAGSRRLNNRQWLIDRAQFVVFRALA